ncbi:DUF6531 domain-containing protein [Butyrivibrio proteoclasticus]|uniref:DUF6531 domain-containing protein n=1 Tax=Butyrivibrio proteoclasticus TaxID=43305 RepID=UPI000479C30C|nr:DUF6531 domain-containing protein [Butyrivibrio proteoclasticus]
MSDNSNKYTVGKNGVYTTIPGAGVQYVGGEQIWDHEVCAQYFQECLDQLKALNEQGSELAANLMEFVNDESHSGYEAEASKDFVLNKLYPTLIDMIRASQILQGKMVPPGFEGSVPLLDDFINDLSENETAILSVENLKKVITDFSEYNKNFKTESATIKEWRDTANSLVKGCMVISVGELPDPSPDLAQRYMDEFVTEDGKDGTVPKLLVKFTDFLNEHDCDFYNCEFNTLIENINTNLDNFKAGLGDGIYDPDITVANLNDIEYIKGSDNADYDAYVDSYKKYINGEEPRSQVYKYDPVNMTTGNFVSSKTDLTVGGAHTIVVKRFYNAQSDVIGALGRGWTLNYEQHLTKKDDETITVFYGDGKEGCFKKTNIGKEEVFFEIHGEQGTLRELDNSYRLSYDDNSYIDFDNEGYITSYGDGFGQHTTVDYDVIEKEIDGKVEKKALPVKVSTKEGSELVFKYDEMGLLVEAKDHTGRTVSYKYEDPKDKYRLTSITAPDGTERKYSYTDNGLIYTSTRPDGVVGVVNEYDDEDRVIHQVMPDGGEFNYSYDDEKNITTAIEPNGCKVEYLSDELKRHIGTRYPDFGIEEKFTYNDKGFKTSHTDRNGYTTRYTYDNRGHLTSIIGPEGLHEFYTYDADGKLSARKDSEGNVTKFKYDLNGNLYAVVNPLREKVTFYYDETGKVISIRDAENKRTNLTYDERGNIASITDPSGITTKYECDSLGRVVATTDAEGNRTTYDIDACDNLKRVVDPEGNVTSYEYNALGKVSAITNPDGTKKTWEYNAIGKPSAYTDEDNRTTRVYYNLSAKEERIVLPNSGNISYEYDLLGNLTKVTDPDGRVTSYTHDKAGNILTIKKADKTIEANAEDGAITVSSYTYDGLGRIKTETDGNGNVTSYEYDNNGNITKVTDPNGGVIAREYDKAGRLVKEIDAADRETLYTYDKNGNRKTTTDPNGVVTENTYKDNRLVKIVQKAGDEEHLVGSYEYDSLGRVKSETQADGFVVSMEYTKTGRISKVTGSNGRTVSYKYDVRGRLAEINDAGKITKNTYTGTGRLQSVTDALGNRTEYTYNELDLLTKVERFGDEETTADENGNFPKVDNNGHVTINEYSLAGNLLSITDALGQKDTYTYDVLGNVKSHIDRDGYETVYTRDNNGNVTGVNYADGKSVKMQYNALNILQEVKDHLGLTKIESDILGRTVSVTDYKGRTVGYEYGPYDNESAIIYPDGKRAEYTYDAFGRLDSLTDGTSDKPITYTYDAAGRLSGKSFPNGVKTALDYYQGGLLKSMTSTDTQGIIDKYVYNYEKETSLVTDIERNRRGMDAVSGTYHYEYDDLGRLTKSTLNGNLRAEYKYDAFGNRTEMTEADTKTSYEYDALDRLTRSIVRDSSNNETSNIYSYDRRGNQVALTSGDIIKKTFKYDAMGKMTHATDTEKGDISYTYNGLGFRVESVRPEEKIEYLCDLSKDYYNLLERTVNGETESFIYDNNVVSMNRGGSNYYYLQDELGSTMYLTGTDGLTVDAYAYDDFGRRVDPYTGKLRNRLGKENKSHAYTKNGNIIQPFAFTGYQEDEVSELNFAQARYYDPNAGRFNGEDKVRGFIEAPETLNHYEYCWNNPLSFIDLDGNWGKIVKWFDEHPKIVGGILVGAAIAGGVALTVCTGGAAAPLVAAAAGAATSAAADLGMQLITSDTGKISTTKIDWASVGASAVSGAVTGYFGSAIGDLGKGVTKLMSGSGSKVVSALARPAGAALAGVVEGTLDTAVDTFVKAGSSILFGTKCPTGKDVVEHFVTSSLFSTIGHWGDTVDEDALVRKRMGGYTDDSTLTTADQIKNKINDLKRMIENDDGCTKVIGERIAKLEERLKLVEKVAKDVVKGQTVSGATKDVVSDVYNYMDPFGQGDVEEGVC